MSSETVSLSVPGLGVQTGVGGGGTPHDISATFKRVAYTYSMRRISSTTSGFHKKRVKPLAPLPFSFSLDVYTHCTGYQIYESLGKPGTYGYQNYMVRGIVIDSDNWYSQAANADLSGLSASELSTCDGRARNSLLTKIKDQKVNAAVATAEFGETMHMIGDTAIKIAGLIHHLRHGNFVKAAESVGVRASKRAGARFSRAWSKDRAAAVGSGWNSLQYGWKPLLQDVYGACEELATKPEQGMICHTKARAKIQRDDMRFQVKSSSDLITQKAYRRTEVQYGVTYYRAFGATQDLPRLGITNPLEIAWELVPYSFVVDWFLPIGNWLGTMDATLGLTFLTGYKTTFQRYGGVQDVLRYPDPKYNKNGGRWSSGRRYIRVNRTILTDFPSPALPTFKNPFSFGHMMNGLALLTNLFRK